MLEEVLQQLLCRSLTAAVEAFSKVGKIRADLAVARVCVLHVVLLVAFEFFSIAQVAHRLHVRVLFVVLDDVLEGGGASQ